MPVVECPVCESTDYFVRDGLQFCSVCQTQSQELGHETVVDDETLGAFSANASTLTKLHIKKRGKTKKDEKVTRWTTAEAYSHILVAWIKEVNKAGDIDVEAVAKDTWITYLSRVGVAFCKKSGLGANPSFRDRWLASGLGHKVPDVRALAHAGKQRIKPEEVKLESDSEEEVESLEARKKRRKKRRQFLKSVSDESVSERESVGLPASSRGSTSQSEADTDTDGSGWVTTSGEESGDESGASTCGGLSLSDKAVIMGRSMKNFTKLSRYEMYLLKGLPNTMNLKQLAWCLALSVVGRTDVALTTADMAYLFNNNIVSFRSAVQNLPSTYKVLSTERKKFMGSSTFTDSYVCRHVYRLASYIGLDNIVMSTSSTMKVVLSNYLQEFSLPASIYQDIASAVEYSNMFNIQFRVGKYNPLDQKWMGNQLPSVPSRALALILLHLKYHFGLDDQQEDVASHNVKKFGVKQGAPATFDFIQWLRLSKLRLDFLMTSEAGARDQYRDLAHVGTEDLTAAAGEREARLQDEMMGAQEDGGGGHQKLQQLTKLIHQLRPGGLDKEERCEQGLMPLHKWTKFNVSKQYLDLGSRNHLSSLMECYDQSMEFHYSKINDLIEEKEDIEDVELAKNWVDISNVQKKDVNKNDTEDKVKREEGTDKATCPKLSDKYVNVEKIYWMNHKPVLMSAFGGKVGKVGEANTNSFFVESDTTTELPGRVHFLAALPSNFRWVLQYFACHAAISSIDLYRELVAIEKFLLANDGAYFGAQVSCKPVRVYTNKIFNPARWTKKIKVEEQD